MDQLDSPQLNRRYPQHLEEPCDPAKDKSGKKCAKDKDRHHGHFGQRLSKAIGLSSSSSSKQQQQQQQRVRQSSVDSLSTIDGVTRPALATATTAEESQQQLAQQQTGKTTPEKEKKGGIMTHFLHRPRLLGSNDGTKSKGATHSSAGSAVGGAAAVLGGNQGASFNTPDASFAQSATSSDISQESESHRREGADGSGSAAGEDSDTAVLRKIQSRHRQDRGSASSGKSLVESLTCRSFRRRSSLLPADLMPQQHQQLQQLPPSIADVVESAQEVHPHHQPGDMERLNLYNHLGLQEIHYSTGTGEDPSGKMIRQLYGSASALRKEHSSTPVLSSYGGSSNSTNNIGVLDFFDHPHPHLTGVNLSESNTSVTSDASTLATATGSSVPISKSTSSRLGKLGRFKFPSLSMGSIHRHKHGSRAGTSSSIQSPSEDQQYHAMMLANFNNKRRSSLMIPFKSSIFESTVRVRPPSPVSHIRVSDSASTFASAITVGMTTLGPSTPGSSSNNSSISSSYNVFESTANGSTTGDSRKPRQSLAAFLEEQAHQPHHSSTNGMSGLHSTTSTTPSTQQQRPMESGKQQPRHQRQQSRSLGMSFAGSEKLTVSMSNSLGSSTSSSSSNSQNHQGIGLAFRSGLLKRSSRRTVSASHISSKNIFGPNPTTGTATSDQEAAALAYQDLMGSQAGGDRNDSTGADMKTSMCHLQVDRDALSTALLQDQAANNPETRRGSHSRIGVGDPGNGGIKSPESTGSVGQYLFGDELENLSFGDRQSILVKVDSAVDTIRADIAETSSGPKEAAPANITVEEPSVVAPVATVTTPTASAASTMTAATISTDQDRVLLAKLLSGKKKSDSFLPSAKDSTLSLATPGSYVSPPPPTFPLHPTVSGVAATPAPGATTTKSKFSILGTSEASNSGLSYLQDRPSLSLTLPSSTGSTSSNGESSSIPNLEPRSAVADYRPAIHYKRQRSMSLQDADLLTADQFIALMPDDAPTKRRFSSEETLADNNAWAMSVKAKNVPLPDSPTTLRSLHSTLKTKCDLVLRHLAAVSAPMSSTSFSTGSQQRQIQQQRTSVAAPGQTVASDASLSSTLTFSTISRSGPKFLSSPTSVLSRRLAEEKETSLAVRPQEQILIRIQGAEDEPSTTSAASTFKDKQVDGRVSMEDIRSRSNAHESQMSSSMPSTTTTMAPAGIRPKKSSLVVGGANSANGGDGRAAEATPTDRASSESNDDSAPSDTPPIDLDQLDLVETVAMLFDEMDQIVSRLVEMLSKYISTDQFSKVLKESDEICYQAQEVCRVELDRRSKEKQQQQKVDQQMEVEPKAVAQGKSSLETMPTVHFQKQRQHQEPLKEQIGTLEQGRQDEPSHAPAQQAQILPPLPTTTTPPNDPVAVPLSSSGTTETGDSEDRQIKNKVSKDRICHRRNQNHYKHQYRYHPQGRKPGEAGANGEMSSEEQQGAVYDYIRTLLTMAEVSMAEYMRTYSRMLVVPTAGYRIEGCNDLKKIERSLRPDHPFVTSLPMTAATSGSSQPSLMSRISAVQSASRITNVAPPGSSQTATPAANSPDSTGALTINASAGDASQVSSPIMNIFSPSNAAPGGQTMVRVKSLPESKDEWAALQKRKEMGGSPGVAGAISMGTPAAVGVGVGTGAGTGAGIGGGIGGIGAVGATAGMMTGTGISMLGEYSKEHMGHEAYYYRNWFLGKEHRTFVGQVEGLGTVIISIIKDMVVPTETRHQIPSRSTTGPNSLTHHSSFVPSASASGGASTNSVGYTRPELVHSTNSFYPGRGYQGSPMTGGGVMMASPRTSSEAMRVILAASTAVASGAGSLDNRGPGSSGMNGSHLGAESGNGSSASPHLAPSTPATPGPHSSVGNQPNHQSTSANSTNAPPRWQYRCILRQKDVDSLRITLPEPESGPLNNLTRRAGKPQWKTILQSIHPAITQQVASKLKKVQDNQLFEKELAKFDETMLRFNYKFGVLLVHPGQTREEDWFSNQMSSSPRFQAFLESGALGQKVALKGFERFSAGLDTRSEGEHSYYDTWGEGFEIMYHVSTLLPYNTVDRQQIQRKRHIGNDIVCVVFVDGDQPFVPNAIKSQFLHIFVIIHLIVLADGTQAYSATIVCDEQVPEFGPPLPDPPIFRTSAELRSFLLCKMINGENAAYKAPRLIKPHQRARSGMLENLVAKANNLAKVKDTDKEKVKDSDKKVSKQQKAAATTAASSASASAFAMAATSLSTSTTSSTLSSLPSAQHTLLSMSSSPNLKPTHPIGGGSAYSHIQQHCFAHRCHYPQQHPYQYGCHHCPYDKDGHVCCSAASLASTSTASLGEEHTHPHQQPSHLVNGRKGGPIPPGIRTNSARNSLVVLGSETAVSLFKGRRKNSNADGTKPDAQFPVGIMAPKDKDSSGVGLTTGGDNSQRQQQVPDQIPEGHGYIENLISPISPITSALPSPSLAPASVGVDYGSIVQQSDLDQCSGSCCQSGCCNSYASCCGCSCCDGLDHPMDPRQSRAQPERTALTNAMKSGAYYHPLQQLNGAQKQSSKSATSSPTESQFAMNRPANAQAEYHPHYHTVSLMNGLDAAMMNAKKKGSGSHLGMSLTANSKGRSKSEVDLLLSPIQEAQNVSPNRHSTGLILGTETTSHPILGTSSINEFHHHHHSNNAGIIAASSHHHHHHHHYSHYQHSYPAASATIPIRSNMTSTTTGQVTHQNATAPAHSSMKGRAHNFLTTLVRRRASSNDTSGLGPTAHQMSAPKQSNLSIHALSPLDNWVSTSGSHCHQYQIQVDHHLQPCHHSHCCQNHRCQHYPPQQRRSLTSLPSNTVTSVAASTTHEGTAAVPIMGRPLKFKEGFTKGKTPTHINTAAAVVMGTSYPNQYYQHSSHHPPSTSTVSSASSSSLYASSLPSASTIPGSTSFRSTSGTSVGGGGHGSSPHSSSSATMMLATPSSSSSTGLSPHSLRSLASREAIHRSTSSPLQNQLDEKKGLGRSISGGHEELTLTSASATGGVKQSESEEKSLSSEAETTRVIDAVDGLQDEVQFTESPLPYTPQAQSSSHTQLPLPASGSKTTIAESRTSIDSLGSQLGGGFLSSGSNSITTAPPTAFPPGVGNLNKTSMDYMSFKPTTSSSARNSLLDQQRYDPGKAAAARVRAQSGDLRQRREGVGKDDEDGCRSNSEDLSRFLTMGPLALRESHSVMAMDHCPSEHHCQCQYQPHHCYQQQHHHLHHHSHHHNHAGFHHHHQHHHHDRQYPGVGFNNNRRPSSGPLLGRNESPATFYQTDADATATVKPKGPTIHFSNNPPLASEYLLPRKSTGSSSKQVKRAVSVESFLGRESVLSKIPSLRSKGLGLEAALLSTIVPPGPPSGPTEASFSSCCDSSTSVPSAAAVLDLSCEVLMTPIQDKTESQAILLLSQQLQQQPTIAQSLPADTSASNVDSTMSTKSVVVPEIVKTRQESVRKSNESQHSCSNEVENLNVKPMDS
ncbi:Rap/ran-GAP protein [Mortierella sp. GBA35]|nr:Rap/ran-GAP protein [Mortierella sp. GBA35]